MSQHSYQPRFRLLVITAAALACAAALATAMTIWWLRSDAIKTASANANSLAVVLAGQIENSVQSLDIVLTDISNHASLLVSKDTENANDVLGSFDTHQHLADLLSHLQQAEFIGLVDKDGRLVSTSQQWPSPRIDVSDRDYFTHLKNHDEKSLFISNAATARGQGTAVVFFSKRINRADGMFLGVAVIGVKLTYFQAIYESIGTLHDRSFLLLQTDGTVVAHYPDVKNRVGEKMPTETNWYQLVAVGGGSFRSPGYFTPSARLVSVRPLQTYPLVVNVAVSVDVALASWRVQALVLGAGALLALLCSAFLLKALAKYFNRLTTVKNGLFQANQQLDAALNNMAQGICMFDARQRLIVCNKRYADLYGLTSEQTKPGTTLRAILEFRISQGAAPDDAENYIKQRLKEVTDNEAYQATNRLSDGRCISVVHQPLADGGWVAMHEDVTERKRSEERIAYLAHYDYLTDLPNRLTFNETINAMIDRAKASDRQLAVLSIDLDHFKEANDNYGHSIGDALLCEVARRLNVAAGGAFLGRIGGDEFMLIVADGVQPQCASALVDRLFGIFVDDFEIEGHRIKLGMSIGVAIYPTDGTDAKTLMINADAALYRAKAEFRGSAQFFEPEMSARLHERHALQQDLQAAIDRGELLLHYQPQKKLSGETVGFEALLRWQCPKRGLVPPGTFIPVAEESNLILPIGEWVLREACREAASWPQPLTIAVNVSPVQFRRGDLPSLVHSVLLDTGLAPCRLELEITESIMIDDFSRAISILNRLKSLGVRIAMDDFGTGYSSLSYLQSFSFDKIKIDRVFICDLEHNHHSRAIVRAVIGLGHSLDLPVIAEGVETEAQHALLVQKGCDEMQGYLAGRPQPIAYYSGLVGRPMATQQNYLMAG